MHFILLGFAGENCSKLIGTAKKSAMISRTEGEGPIGSG
jgi:hypothetical protein